MARTNISIDEEVAASLSDEATKENKTIYALSNESLKAILNICRNGGRPEEVFLSWMFTRILRDLDTVPTPGDLIEKLLKKLYESDKEWLLRTWFEEGQRIGAYLRLSTPRMLDLAEEAKDISKIGLLPVKRLDMENEGDDGFTVRVVGAGLSEESTSCADQLIKGIISAYSLHVVSSKMSEGIIELRVSDKGAPVPIQKPAYR
ncbi:MAG: hypothetical protein OK455_03585 [Thaumarchaeota archaeon]|nr:hypothetical protein [Nitrososphaerota archaeon]